MCGATAMKYYLPTLLEVLGLGHRVALMAGGIESTLKIGMTLLDSVLIDRMGRRLTLAVGAGAMAFATMVRSQRSSESDASAGLAWRQYSYVSAVRFHRIFVLSLI
jgi:hypothetical protein